MKTIFPELMLYFGLLSTQYAELGIAYMQNSEISNITSYENNMFKLLLTNEYTFNDCITTFKKISYENLSSDLQRRLQIRNDVELYVTNSEGENKLELTSEELDMVDKIVQFRNGQTPTLINDWTQLQSNLSKLIYAEITYDPADLISYNDILKDVHNNMSSVPNIQKPLVACYSIRLLVKTIAEYS